MECIWALSSALPLLNLVVWAAITATDWALYSPGGTLCQESWWPRSITVGMSEPPTRRSSVLWLCGQTDTESGSALPCTQVSIINWFHPWCHSGLYSLLHASCCIAYPCSCRCVLAASSPVFASLLSSAGALVELQASYLSGSVLGLVLDYIYTGALPHACTQQQYYSLLTAAHHLQMDELQEALRSQVNLAHDRNASTGAEGQSHEDTENTYSKMVNTYLPLADTCRENSLEREAQFSDVSPLSSVSTSCSAPESSESSVNTGICSKVSCLTPQDLIQRIICTAEVHRVSRVGKDLQRDQFHSAGTVKAEGWHLNTERELLRTAENRRSLYLLHSAEVQGVSKEKTVCSTAKSHAEVKQIWRKEEDEICHSPLLHFSTAQLNENDSPSESSFVSSPSSPRPYCSAVPVIRHSSIASMAEVSMMPPYHPVSKVSVGFNRRPDSQLGSTGTDRITESITTKLKRHNRARIQDYRNKSWEHDDSSDQCRRSDSCPKSNADQSDILKQDYPSSSTDHDEYMGNGLNHITDDDDRLVHCDSFTYKSHTNHPRGESMPTIKDCSSFSGGSENKSDLSFDDFPFKHQRLDCSDCHSVAMAPAAEEQSNHPQGQRAVVSLPVQDPETGSDPHCEDVCPEGEAKEEHSYSSWCPSEIEGQDSQCDLYGPKNDWYPNLQRAEMGSKDSASSQCEHDDKDSATENDNGRTYLEHENPGPWTVFTMPLDDNTSDHTYNFVGQSYRGHLRYHCLPQDYSYSSRRDSDQSAKSSHPDRSDQSGDEEAVCASASPGLSPLRQHFASSDQILLLDISTKPSELLVSYRHRCDEQEKWVSFRQRDTSGNGLGDNNREHEPTSAAGVVKRKFRARARNGAESCNEATTKPWAGETDVEERRSVVSEQSRPGAEVIHRADAVESENQPTTLTVCSTPSELDSVQAPVSSTLSACMPSTLSTSMPTSISSHLSTPVHHPFQCSMCDRSFSQRGSLNRHVRSHLGVRPFPCPRCPMTFSRQYRVSEHMRVHQRCVISSDCEKPAATPIEKMPQKWQYHSLSGLWEVASMTGGYVEDGKGIFFKIKFWDEDQRSELMGIYNLNARSLKTLRCNEERTFLIEEKSKQWVH